MEWKTEKRKVGELIAYESNPRVLTEKQRIDLVASLKKFSLAEIPVVNLCGTILAGHQRISILIELYGTDYEIDVRVPTEQLSEDDVQEYNIRSNQNGGGWDFDLLKSDFQIDDLKDWGFSDDELGLKMSGKSKEDEDGDIEFVTELDEESNYIVLKFDTDIDWLQIQTLLDLKRGWSRRCNGKPWSKGIGRVVNGPEALARIAESMRV